MLSRCSLQDLSTYDREVDDIVARGGYTKLVAVARKDLKNALDELRPIVYEYKVSEATGTSLPSSVSS